jgi:hypothetical protein
MFFVAGKTGSIKPTRRNSMRGVAWRGVAWRGVAWRGVAYCTIALKEFPVFGKHFVMQRDTSLFGSLRGFAKALEV